MDSKIKKLLKECSEDGTSFKQLKNVVENISEKQQRLAQKLQLLESAIRTDYDSIMITELQLKEPGPCIVYVNDGFCKMTGYTREEVIGKTPRLLQGSKTDRSVLNKLKKRLRNGCSFFGQAVNYRKDGSEFINQWDIHPLTNKNGKITHWVSYQHDITKRKKAEQKLRNANAEFHKLREKSMFIVVDIDMEGDILAANKAFRKLCGYTNDELTRLKAWNLVLQKHRSDLRQHFEDDTAFFEEEFEGIIMHKDNLPIQVNGDTQVVNSKKQRFLRVKIKNISLQKKVKRALKKRNLEFDQIVDKACEFTYHIFLEDGKPVVEHLSETFPRITGIAHDEVLGKKTLGKFIHRDDLPRFYEHLHTVNEGEKSTCKYRLKSADGSYINVMDYGTPQWSANRRHVNGIEGAVSVDPAYQKTSDPILS